MQNKYQNISRSYSKPTNKHQSNPLVKIVILAIVLLVGFWLWNTYASATTGVPTDSPKGLVQLVVNKGDNLSSVGDQLVKQKALNASWSLQWLAQSQEKWALQPGKYTVTTPAKPDEILKQLQKKSDELYKKSLSPSKQVVSLTFKEGETVDDIIKKLAEKDLSTTAELQKIAQDPTAFSRTAYPFLPVPLTCQYGNMTNCAKYYLEGFLYPDTYDFFTTATPKEIFGKLLDNFELKVWEKVKADVGNKDFQKIITMASVIERETGRPIDGVNDSNIDTLNREKKMVAGVLYNRVSNNMKWGSDPTVTYGTGRSLCQQTLTSQKGCLYLNSPESNNKYNTYDNPGYPIGPITSPQYLSIIAALEPTDSDNIFFVADAAGRKYFAVTGDQHEANIAKVSEINKQYR